MGKNAVETPSKGFPVYWLVMPQPYIAAFDAEPGVVFQIVQDNNDIRWFVRRRESDITLVQRPARHVGGQEVLIGATALRGDPHHYLRV